MQVNNTLLFSTGCSINVISEHNSGSEAVIIFVSDCLWHSHEMLRNNPAIEKLKSRFSAVFYDFRGTGESAFPLSGMIGNDDIIDDLKCVVNFARETFKGQAICLFAASYGAVVALSFLQKYPDSIDKLILDSPIMMPCCSEVVQPIMDGWKKNAKRTLGSEMSSVIHDYPSSDEGLCDFLKTPQLRMFMASNHPVKGDTESLSFHYAMQDFLPTFDSRQSLCDVAVETLMLVGKRDRIFSSDITLKAAKSAQNGNICLYPFNGYGHRIFNQNSDEFARICTEFIFG